MIDPEHFEIYCLASQCDTSVFFSTHDKRSETLNCLVDFLDRTRKKERDLPSFLWEEINTAIELLLSTNLTFDSIWAESKSPQERGSRLIRAYLIAWHQNLEPVGKAAAMGAAKARSLSISEQIRMAVSDPVSFDVVCSLAGYYVLQDEPMETDLRQFVADVLSGERSRPRASNGPKPYSYSRRDRTIIEALSLGEAAGLNATRNDVSTSISGCDVVA